MKETKESECVNLDGISVCKQTKNYKVCVSEKGPRFPGRPHCVDILGKVGVSEGQDGCQFSFK